MAENSYNIGSLEPNQKDKFKVLYEKINPKGLKERMGKALQQLIDKKQCKNYKQIYNENLESQR